MYLHCKHGFVEADAWDGQPIDELPVHTAVLATITAAGECAIVVRSRRRDTLHSLIADLPRYKGRGHLPVIAVFESPKWWDYEFRCYLTATEWGQVLASVAMDLDYRNFKSYAAIRAPQEAQLAADIWHAAAHTGRRTRNG
jgi:hypothetical protein